MHEVGEITVRPARVDDVERLTEIHVEGYEIGHRGVVPDEVIAERTPELRRRVWTERLSEAPPHDVVLVAEADGEIVGFVSGRPALPEDEGESEHAASWENLYMEPSLIGTDAGRRTYTALVEEMWETFLGYGYTEVMAYVHEQNPRSIRFLEKVGWLPDGGTREGEAGRELRIRRTATAEAER